MATFTAGIKVTIGDGRLHVVADTTTWRFVARLQQRTNHGRESVRSQDPHRASGRRVASCCSVLV